MELTAIFFVHELRNATMDFEFLLYHLVQQLKLEDLYEKWVHMPTWTIDTVITHHSLARAMMLAKSSPTHT